MAMIHIAAYSGEPVVLKWCIEKDKSSINLVNVRLCSAPCTISGVWKDSIAHGSRFKQS